MWVRNVSSTVKKLRSFSGTETKVGICTGASWKRRHCSVTRKQFSLFSEGGARTVVRKACHLDRVRRTGQEARLCRPWQAALRAFPSFRPRCLVSAQSRDAADVNYDGLLFCLPLHIVEVCGSVTCRPLCSINIILPSTPITIRKTIALCVFFY